MPLHRQISRPGAVVPWASDPRRRAKHDGLAGCMDTPQPRSGGHGGSRSNAGGARANSGGARPNSGPKPKPKLAIAPASDQVRWYCVLTKAGALLQADIALRVAGFTVFNPSVWKAASRPRRHPDGTIQRGKPDRIEPMFKRYFFVQFAKSDGRWREIWQAPGVVRIISCSASSPTPIPDATIAAVRAVCAPNGCAYPAGQGALAVPPLAAGTDIRILGGSLAELRGICTWSDGKRVKLLLEILGRSVPLTVAQTEVEAV